MLPAEISLHKALIWTIRVMVAVAFVLAGAPKILGDSQWIINFQNWGFPAWFRVIVGWFEVLGALALVNNRTALYAAAGLAMIMFAATVTQLANNGIVPALTPLGLALLCAIVLADRWPRVMKREIEEDPEFADYTDEENIEAKML